MAGYEDGTAWGANGRAKHHWQVSQALARLLSSPLQMGDSIGKADLTNIHLLK
jgi:hypothetical protein